MLKRLRYTCRHLDVAGCPVCGGEAQITTRTEKNGSVLAWISCCKCPTATKVVSFRDKNLAGTNHHLNQLGTLVNAWNSTSLRRWPGPDMDDAQAAILRLMSSGVEQDNDIPDPHADHAHVRNNQFQERAMPWMLKVNALSNSVLCCPICGSNAEVQPFCSVSGTVRIKCTGKGPRLASSEVPLDEGCELVTYVPCDGPYLDEHRVLRVISDWERAAEDRFDLPRSLVSVFPVRYNAKLLDEILDMNLLVTKERRSRMAALIEEMAETSCLVCGHGYHPNLIADVSNEAYLIGVGCAACRAMTDKVFFPWHADDAKWESCYGTLKNLVDCYRGKASFIRHGVKECACGGVHKECAGCK